MSSSSSSSMEQKVPSEQRRRRHRPKARYGNYDVSAASQNPIDCNQSRFLSPDVPHHLYRKQQQAPPRDVRKVYQNPTSSYFIPGISGKARCLDDETPTESDSKSIGSISSSRSIGAASMFASTRTANSYRASFIPTTHRHISEPSSPTSESLRRTAAQNTRGRQRVASKSLDNVRSSRKRLDAISRFQPNPIFPIKKSDSSTSLNNSLLLQNQLETIRAMLSEDAKR